MSTEEIEERELDGEKVEIVQDVVFLGAKKCISFSSSAVWL